MELDFKHVFMPGEPGQPVLLLLHGTGGNEHDLIGLGRSVAPQAGLLSVRGKVLENGMPRFFRRLAEGVFDLEDLAFRTQELADFIAQARTAYGITQPIYALGYSNGANIAASLLLASPDALQGAALLRAMVPYVPAVLPDLTGKPVLMLSGQIDPIVPAVNSVALGEMFKNAGAEVDFRMKPAGHGLVQSDFDDIQGWIASKAVK